jgi:hypothetical protein
VKTRDTSLQLADELMVGNWQLNLPKSSLPGPAPLSEVRSHHWEGEFLHYRSTVIGPTGAQSNVSFAARQDGTEFQVLGNPAADSIAIVHAGPRAWFSTVRLRGRITRENHVFLSADGNTLVSVGHEIGIDGKKISSSLLIYDRLTTGV